MSGIIVGLFSGLLTPGWVLLLAVPVLYGIVIAVWQTAGDVPAKNTICASMAVGERAASNNTEAMVVAGVLHALMALMGTGIGLALRMLLL